VALVHLHGAGGLRLTTAHELLIRKHRAVAFEWRRYECLKWVEPCGSIVVSRTTGIDATSPSTGMTGRSGQNPTGGGGSGAP
jgi:hypothetical protein